MAQQKKVLSESKKHYTNAEKEIKKETEEKNNQLAPLQPDPPSWLTELAQEEYKLLYPLIMELPVKNLDLSMLCLYVQAYADYQQATKELEDGDVVTFTDRGSKINPWHRVKVDSYGIMNSIAGKLGLTIDSRLKILESKDEEKDDDPFKGMM